MSGTHVTVALSDSARCGQVTVLSVHVVSATARVITQPDTKVLDGCWSLLVNLLTEKDFSLSLLHLAQHRRKVPVARLGLRTIRRKDAHLVDRRSPHLTGRHHPTYHLVLLQISARSHRVDCRR